MYDQANDDDDDDDHVGFNSREITYHGNRKTSQRLLSVINQIFNKTLIAGD